MINFAPYKIIKNTRKESDYPGYDWIVFLYHSWKGLFMLKDWIMDNVDLAIKTVDAEIALEKKK